MIGAVEAMLNGVAARINGFIDALNGALELLPDWATGEGGVRIGRIESVALGRIDNPYAGAAASAGNAASDAFNAALGRRYIDTPDLGLGAMAEEARDRASAYQEAAGMLSEAASHPLGAWQALKDAVTGSGSEAEAALASATTAADGLGDSLDRAGGAAGGAGGAARERVLSRREAALYGGREPAAPTVTVAMNVRDAESFRQSRTQIAADIARAVSRGRRGL